MTDTHHEQEDITLDDLKVRKGTHSNDQPSYGRGWYEIKMTGKLPERRSY
jgi:hypothetical protein